MQSAASSGRPGYGGGPAVRPQTGLLPAITRSRWTYRIAALLIFGVAWEWYGRQAHSLLIPTASATVAAVGRLVLEPSTWNAFLLSNQALVLGFAISVILGIPLGLAAARFSRAEQFADPYLNVLLVTPTAALIPLFLMALGLGLVPRVLMVVVFAIPMLIVNSRAGVRQVDPSTVEMATSFGASERQIWRKVLLPGALPAIMTGVRLGLGRAVTGMVIVELLMVAVGIGNLIIEARGSFDSDVLYGVVILVVLEALALISVARWVERRVAPWAHSTSLSE